MVDVAGEKAWLKAWVLQNPLRRFRQKRGFTVAEVCALLSVVPMTLYRWEHGQVIPSKDFHHAQAARAKGSAFGRMAVLMGIDVEDLIELWDHWQTKKTLHQENTLPGFKGLEEEQLLRQEIAQKIQKAKRR